MRHHQRILNFWQRVVKITKIDVHLPPIHPFILLILLPLFFMVAEPLTGINFKGNLDGFFDIPQKAVFSIGSYNTHNYQKNFESWFSFNIGLRGYIIRLYNQFQFTFFNLVPNGIVGKNKDIFESAYIDAECGLTSKTDFSIPQNFRNLKSYVNHLESIQGKLGSIGKSFIFLITPSKATVNFNDIPLKYRLKRKYNFTPPYFYLKKLLSQKNINHIDSRDLFLKDGIPNFYTTGIHWARPIEQRFSQILIEKMSLLSKRNLPRISLGKLKVSKEPFTRETDIFNNANIFFKPHGTYFEYEAQVDTTKNKQEPKFLIQGGSFAEGFYSFDYAAHSKKSYKFFYDKIYRKRTNADVPISKWEDVDFTEILDSIDVVIIEANEAYIPHFSDGFVEFLDNFLDSYKIKPTVH